jgi:hypothetical protein
MCACVRERGSGTGRWDRAERVNGGFQLLSGLGSGSCSQCPLGQVLRMHKEGYAYAEKGRSILFLYLSGHMRGSFVCFLPLCPYDENALSRSCIIHKMSGSPLRGKKHVDRTRRKSRGE